MSKYDCDLTLEDRNSLSVLLKQVKPNSTILEFGPANGRMTKYMKEQLDCKVYAVEIDEDSARDAEQYTEKIIVDSIENYHWKNEFKDIKFDYIIFADVLEHLYYPEKVLSSVHEFLKDDGSVLISIPNIAHNAIIINLMKNEFNYSPTGLLDDTHIRFFTKKTFDGLVEKCGFFSSMETAIFMNPENTEFHNSYNDLPEETSKYIQELYYGEVYQFIYELKKYKSDITSDFSDKYKTYSQYFIQLFIEDENCISEENSLKLPVLQNDELQTFEFELSDRQNIKTLRLDLLNDYCIIKINKILVDEIEITSFGTNACHTEENIYYFNTKDPQLYVDTTHLESVEKMSVDLEYLHTGEDALNHVVNDLLKAFTTKEQNIQTLNAELDSKEQNIQTLNAELVGVYMSKSWKITRPLRSLVRKFKKDNN